MKYAKYVLKKFLTMAVTLLLASFVVFILIRMSAVDPITVMTKNKPASDAVRMELTQEYNLDKPVVEQYFIWLKGVVQGDLGKDYVKQQDVAFLIKGRLPLTLTLVLYSTVLSLIVAIPAGVICALKKNTVIDQIISTILLLMSSVPGFVISILMLVIVSKYFPAYSFVGLSDNFWQMLSRLTLPAMALACNSVALFARITRSSMIQQLKSGYVTTAEAKGIRPIQVIFGHAFHNGILPVLTVVTVTVGSSISYGVLVESVFSLTGVGNLLIESIKSYNYPVVQILVLMLLIIFMVIGFLSDILYVALDPRVDLE